jgi:predicted DsbA family dithiol-disulfide isomerase
MLLRAAARVDSERGTALQSALQERLMAGYFTRGENLSRRETLIEAAHEAGLAIEQAERALADVTLRTEVASIERELQSLGVSSVPTFIFARRFAFSGAQEVPVFLEALDEAARDGH